MMHPMLLSAAMDQVQEPWWRSAFSSCSGDLNALSMQLNLVIKEVSWMQKAYEMMIGRKL
jgi:hypothetical protein